MLVVRAACISYWVLLTALLLAPNPLWWLGIRRLPGHSTGFGVHFLCFAALGLLVSASRFRVKWIWLGAGLIGFALATELLQALVPLRSVEAKDLAENLLGLMAGAAIWQFIRAARRRKLD